MEPLYKQVISIEDIQVEANIGVYPIEKQEKNKFSIDIFITIHTNEISDKDELSQTLDYQEVYNIVLKEMEIPANLLEVKADRICAKIQNIQANIFSIRLKIKKLKPMYMEKCAYAAIEITKNIIPI